MEVPHEAGLHDTQHQQGFTLVRGQLSIDVIEYPADPEVGICDTLLHSSESAQHLEGRIPEGEVPEKAISFDGIDDKRKDELVDSVLVFG